MADRSHTRTRSAHHPVENVETGTAPAPPTDPGDGCCDRVVLRGSGSDAPGARPVRSTSDEYGHLAPLLAEFAAMAPDDARRRDLRNELATGYWPVVAHIALRYRNRGEPLADLEQVGAIGLMGALQRFDPDRADDFLSFAVPTIAGEIRRHFRDRAWAMRVPRPVKDLRAPVHDAVETLSTRLRRAPRPSEIGAHLGIARERVVEALNAAHAYAPDSLDELVHPTGVRQPLGDLIGELDTAMDAAECRHELRAALNDLPERERTIVVLRFFEDLTQTQIGARVGLSQMHVSRLLTRSMATLRDRMGAA